MVPQASVVRWAMLETFDCRRILQFPGLEASPVTLELSEHRACRLGHIYLARSLQLGQPLFLACLGGLAILYPTWVNPQLQQAPAHKLRHHIRVWGTSMICLVPLLTHLTTGLLPAGIALVAISAGLILRVRAFLYVGKIVFLLNAVYQLLILSFAYPLLKWVVGLIAGLGFIIIAANFETRHAQLSTLMNYWADALQDWE